MNEDTTIQEYEISTVRDIYEKIPLDRLDDFLKEFGAMLHLAKSTGAFTESLFEDVGLGNLKPRFAEKIVWKDDRKGEITTTVSINEQQFLKFERKLKKDGE